MRAIRKIITGLDIGDDCALSDGSRAALEQMRWVAKSTGARVTLMHSIHPDERWDPHEKHYVAVAEGCSEQDRRPFEDALSSIRDAGIDAELVVTEERAWLAIVQRVLRDGTDLVFVGKRAGASDDGRKLGSVSQKLTRKCPCAVWAVESDGRGRPRSILAATDLTAVGSHAVELAALLAAESGAELHVVHAMAMPMSVQLEGERSEAEFVRDHRKAAVERIKELLAPQHQQAEFHIGLASPTCAVLECVDRLKPELVVMGTISRGGIAGLLVGNTAERLMARLDCSILTVKPEDFVCPVSSG
jgi:universal stress protein E